jgi:hypothetical protein
MGIVHFSSEMLEEPESFASWQKDQLAPAFPPREWEETEEMEEWSHSDSKRGVTRAWGDSQMNQGHKEDGWESRDRGERVHKKRVSSRPREGALTTWDELVQMRARQQTLLLLQVLSTCLQLFSII